MYCSKVLIADTHGSQRLVKKRKKEKRIKSCFNQIEISVNGNEWFNVWHGS